jgi:xylulose-5-phosphate/fructose-6-phosphate phosphoketolase
MTAIYTDTAVTGPLSPELARKMNAYWRAANYLSVGQIYLYDNPLLRRRHQPSAGRPGQGQ